MMGAVSERLLLQTLAQKPLWIGGTLRFNAGYSGPILRVWDGTSFFDVCSVNAIPGLCGSNNGFVSTIYDQSGNARHMTQAATTKLPKIYDGASTSLLRTNARGPCVMRFDGVDDYLSRADGCGLVGNQALTYWQLAKTLHFNGGFSHWGTTANTGGDFTPQYQLNQFINGSNVCRVTSQAAIDKIWDGFNSGPPLQNIEAFHDDIIMVPTGSSTGQQWFLNTAVPPNQIDVTTGNLNLNNAGAGIGARTAGNLPLNGDIACIGVWNPQLVAADKAILTRFGLVWRTQ
jgi:hypothetical protein